MNKKLISIDLDGTLLTPDYKLLPFSERVLKELEKEGHIVLLSSGRPLRNILPFYNQANLKGPLIAYNGALALYPNRDLSPIIKKKISYSFVNSIIKEFDPYLKNYLLELNDQTLYLKKEETALQPYFPYSDKNLKNLCKTSLKEDIFIAVFECDPLKEEELRKKIESDNRYLYRHWNKMPYCEIGIKDIDKGEALKVVAKSLNFKQEDIIAFGDGDNDASMLAFAKNGFAIRNTRSALLRERFSLTEKGNADEGVAHTLNNLFNLKLS